MKQTILDPARRERIRNEASEWFVAFCEADIDGAGREAFDQWLKTSPDHLRAYLRISAVWESADRLNYDLPLPATTGRDRRTLSQMPFKALAASLLLVCAAAAAVTWWFQQGETYKTAAAERRSIQLPDGSMIQLNARSAVKVRYTSGERGITLADGEALFSVVKDAQWPFVVHVGESQFRAVGTQFDIYRKPSQATITVVEGQVSVDHDAQQKLLVSAGEQAKIGVGAPRVAYKTNVASATSWTEGTLIFAATALEEVVEEYNRTGLRRLVIADPNLLKYHISGVFPAADPEPMVKFLQQRFGVIVKETRSDIHIYPPSKE
jgi:transmembrane sensor